MSEALVRVEAGRVDEVAAAYDDHQRDLHAFALAIMRDREEADDIVGETFLRFVREVREGRAPERTRAWLFTVCTNVARGRLRRRSVADRWRHMLGGRDAAGEAAEAAAIRHEQHAELHRALATLSAEQRIVLLLAARGFAGEEIALMIGRSHGATRTLLWRSRAALRDRLTEGGGR
jgi:RNA polymerase sigma-70 factor (ECF subfamily)